MPVVLISYSILLGLLLEPEDGDTFLQDDGWSTFIELYSVPSHKTELLATTVRNSNPTRKEGV
jgi:hypothetical protein